MIFIPVYKNDCMIIGDKENAEINRQLLMHELEVIEEAVVVLGDVELKPSQCFHIESDPPHVLFNENCPESLKERINEILRRYGVAGIVT
jgi:hypothetical protein